MTKHELTLLKTLALHRIAELREQETDKTFWAGQMAALTWMLHFIDNPDQIVTELDMIKDRTGARGA